MKTRNGFVSNSSSSSFIVAFDEKPQKDELLNILYPVNMKMGRRPSVSPDWGDGSVDARSATKIIYDQLKDKKPLTKKQILEEISGGYFEGYPQISHSTEDDPSWKIASEYTAATGKNIHACDADPAWRKRYEQANQQHWDAQRKLVDDAAKAYFDKVYSTKFKGKKCYEISFSDNDGDVFATLEHGNTFDNIPHIKISHH
jgi:hypothetical protein